MSVDKGSSREELELPITRPEEIYSFAGQSLSPEQLVVVERMLGGLGLHGVEISYQESGTPVVAEAETEQEPEPVEARKSDALIFGEQHNYSAQAARLAWSTLLKTLCHRLHEKPGVP